jgi:hypothetical protein
MTVAVTKKILSNSTSGIGTVKLISGRKIKIYEQAMNTYRRNDFTLQIINQLQLSCKLHAPPLLYSVPKTTITN